MHDDVDFQILAHLLREPFASNEALGRAVDLTGTTVRARLEKLRTSGVLRGFRLVPSPETLGRVHEIWSYPAVRNAPAVARVIEVEDVAWASEWHDGGWTIHGFVTREGRETPPELDATLGVQGVNKHADAEAITRDRPRNTVLSPLDWRLLAALLEEPRATAVTLAERSGLSPKLVRKRRANLHANGHMTILPEIGYGAARGFVLFDLLLVLDEPIGRAANDLVPEGVVIKSNKSPPSTFFFCRAGSVQEITKLEHRLSDAPGVERVEALFPMQREYATARFRTWIDEQNRRWAARGTRR